MRVHADLSQPAIVTPGDYRWVDSPQQGVNRMMLDRIGEECARATSLVRYERGTSFPSHVHPGGEEILVLEGIFRDDGGDHPAGCYLRHPSGSSHAPSSTHGTTIFVKLRQMDEGDTRDVRVDTSDPSQWAPRPGGMVCILHTYADESVAIHRLDAGYALFDEPVDNLEIFVVSGELYGETTAYPQGSWLRFPSGRPVQFVAGREGVTVYLKTGHLPC